MGVKTGLFHSCFCQQLALSDGAYEIRNVNVAVVVFATANQLVDLFFGQFLTYNILVKPKLLHI